MATPFLSEEDNEMAPQKQRLRRTAGRERAGSLAPKCRLLVHCSSLAPLLAQHIGPMASAARRRAAVAGLGSSSPSVLAPRRAPAPLPWELGAATYRSADDSPRHAAPHTTPSDTIPSPLLSSCVSSVVCVCVAFLPLFQSYSTVLTVHCATVALRVVVRV
eukprot:scaffold7282_cov113-Isochrysis_galbana.AAC.12